MNKKGEYKKRASFDALFKIADCLGDKLLILMLLGGVCLFVAYPMLSLFLRSLRSAAGGLSLEAYRAVFSGYGQNLINSLFTAALTSIICTLLSLCVALVIATGWGWRRTLCMLLLLVTLVSPPFVSSLAYIQLYGRRGLISYGLLGISRSPYNCWGVIAMQSVSFVPLSALMLSGILERADSAQLLAARDLGAGPKRLLAEQVLPMLRPGILVSLLLAFVRSLADFGTPVIIGGRFSTLASEIYLQVVGYSNLEKASAMNMLLMLPSVLVFFAYRRLMEKLDTAQDREKKRRLELKLGDCGSPGALILGLSGLFFAAMFLQYACIFMSAISKNTKNGFFFTGEFLRQLWRYDGGTMLRSVGYALFIAVFGTVFAMFLAYYVNRRKIPGSRFFDCLATMPYMIPGTCFGIGYIIAFNHQPLKLTGTALIVLANMLFKQLPTATKICTASLAQISAAQDNSARDLGAGKLRLMFGVIIPQLRPAFFSCFVYNFSSSMTTAGAILFLIDPGRKLAVFRLFDAVYTGDYGIASAIASLIILIVLAVEMAAYLLIGRAGNKDVS